ncbi:MAG: hypothetical protein KIT74_09550 [Fimbriimonadales bacterium]|nr:hypothetical protein [Fimbriimonadales bacterium]
MSAPRTIWFIFGKHNHWTGMVWEWGEDTLVNSTVALRRVVEETGLKVGLNFDGRGIEQLASISPESIGWLRNAIRDGQIEIWGGTYTQPYGGLIGPESNVRQRTEGVAVCERVLGVRPKIFSEEEFDFFPQLPQLLVSLGYEAALLFPQHTWHTPTWPMEDDEVVLWEAPNGDGLPAIPYSKRCLMRGIPTAIETLKHPLLHEHGALMITWLEILDKPNWMWRTEFAVPFLKELLAQKEVCVKPTLIAEWIERKRKTASPPVRRYSLDECFHGITAGKNGDALPRLWRRAEREILRAEFLAAWCSLLGQPYPQFDAYPEWQLAEAWRNLMMSQGHDAYECEGFTNRIGHRFAQMAIMLAKDVVGRCEKHLGRIADPPQPSTAKKILRGDGLIAPDVSMYGEAFDENTGELVSLRLGRGGENVLGAPVGLPSGWKSVSEPSLVERDGQAILTTQISGPEGKGMLKWTIATGAPRGQLVLEIDRMRCGVDNAITLPIRCAKPIERWRVDAPFSIEEVHPHGKWLTRQPTAHWLTSTQEDRWVVRPIVHQTLISADWNGGGLLFLSAQNSLAVAQDDGFDEVIFAWDAWDQGKYAKSATIDFQLYPSGSLLNSGLLAHSQLFLKLGFGEFLQILGGRPCITAIRKVGEELELRLFEPDGEEQEVELGFLWEIENVRRVDLFGETVKRPADSFENRVRLTLKPKEIATLRILFVGKRTEYLPIDEYRSVWVG